MKQIVSLTLYAEVENQDNGSVTVRDLYNGTEYQLVGPDVLHRLNSADTFTNIKQVSRTAMAEILLEAGDKVFTVSFVKQDGNCRVLRGRLISSEPTMGRAMVEDFDLSAAISNIRQVDLRTLKYLILGNTKYVVK